MKRANTSRYNAPNWITQPISPTCELITGKENGQYSFCDHPTNYAYPADGGGWMALCERHGKKHLPHIMLIEDLITAGETFS